jgi:aspartyl-tRNA(Asn)/glutamyl-tRNA(Gln) amidotransferase subunit A
MMNLAFATISDIAQAVADGSVSPVDLTRSVLDQIERLDGRLNCYITVLGDAALDQARAAEEEIRRGRYRGPLHGIPIAVKDNIETAGVRSTGGSKILADYVPAEDAPAVARLKAAGAVIVGKTNLHELGMGATSVNPHYGPSRNPWNPECITGGSSGGSAAAVAAGMCLAALGTDAGGSVRIPSALCGVVGLKQTHGRVPVRGCIGAVKPTVDHIGPIARSVADAALLLRVMAGSYPRDPTTENVPPLPSDFALSEGVSGLRIGVPREHYWVGVDQEVEALVRAAIDQLSRLGASVDEVTIRDHDALRAGLAGLDGETPVYHQTWMRTRLRDYGRDVQVNLLARQLIPASDYAIALRVRRLLADRYRETFQRVDVLATPTVIVPAYPIADADGTTALDVPKDSTPLSRNTILANLTGLPAISILAGFTRSGLPVGLQLTGRAYDEATVLRAAAAYEAATDWHTRRPSIVE